MPVERRGQLGVSQLATGGAPFLDGRPTNDDCIYHCWHFHIVAASAGKTVTRNLTIARRHPRPESIHLITLAPMPGLAGPTALTDNGRNLSRWRSWAAATSTCANSPNVELPSRRGLLQKTPRLFLLLALFVSQHRMEISSVRFMNCLR